jgi:hypothetical protein
MAHYAKVENGIVTQVIVAEQDFINSGAVGDPSSWIQTSYNTVGGVHKTGGSPLRHTYAGVGFSYIKDLDVFVPPKPFPSWVLNRELPGWEAPKPAPTPVEGKVFLWNEYVQRWDESESIVTPSLGN